MIKEKYKSMTKDLEKFQFIEYFQNYKFILGAQPAGTGSIIGAGPFQTNYSQLGFLLILFLYIFSFICISL